MDAAIVAQARAFHSDPARGYHGWDHPLALLRHFESVRDSLHDPVAVEAAILFHDAIYDPKGSDNEPLSAKLAAQVLEGHVAPETLARTVRMIEATQFHALRDDISPEEAHDTAIFLDLDLSILGASPEAFDAYEEGVRKEYGFVPEAAFKAGRAAILERFLARERLYMSPWGLERFEAAARRNLERSLAALKV